VANRLANGMYPLDTPIGELGLDTQEVALLTDGAKRLRKQDLIVLRETKKQYYSQGEDKVVQVFDQQTGLSLTLGDLASIAYAFDHAQDRRDLLPRTADVSVSCCCCSCTPCCCCSASAVISATR
jgi:hypothetical protein